MVQLINPADVGAGITQQFYQGMQKRREMETQNALSQYALNPDDPKAMEGLARYNPQMAIQLRAQRQQEAMRGLEAHREKIVMGAKIVRQINPKDDADWQRVLQMAQQVGIDLADVPKQFDPQYVQGLIGVAEALAPQREAQDPSFIREADMLGIPRNEAAELWRKKQGIVVVNGIPHMVQPDAQSGPQPGTVEDGYRFKGGNPADPNSWEQVQGGQMGSAPSGGFQP